MKAQIILFIFLVCFTNAYSQNDSTGIKLRHANLQISIITPPLSTNGTNYYKTVNDLSLNTFLGISAGTERLEVAGFANVNLYYNKGLQVAGFANVNGTLPGSNNYQSEGLQVAGFGIINGNSFTGLQVSGFGIINQEFSGIQVSGFANTNNKAYNAIEVAGFANINNEVKNVAAIAGFANVAVKGKSKSQIAGFANIASETSGLQVAGFGNVAKDFEGAQVAGFINVARNVKGVQVASFINICDSIDGIPISFISIVRKNGYRSFEFSLSEWAPIQISYRMGVKKFYNIYSLSKLAKSWNTYAIGFGIGHNLILSDNTQLNLELTNHHSFKTSGWNNYFNQYSSTGLLQFKPVFKKCISDEVCLNFGPTLNYSYGYSNYNGNYSAANRIQPFWEIKNPETNNTAQNISRVWIGFTAGISLN